MKPVHLYFDFGDASHRSSVDSNSHLTLSRIVSLMQLRIHDNDICQPAEMNSERIRRLQEPDKPDAPMSRLLCAYALCHGKLAVE